MSPTSLALQPVATSTPLATIWSGVSEDIFRTHLVSLEERTNAVPIEVVHSPAPIVENVNSREEGLPLEVEKQIADDLAFIAAVTEGAQSVAAVCLEQHIDDNGTTLHVRVAGMDVVDEKVRGMLDKIVHIFQLVSSHTFTAHKVDSDHYPNQIFQLISEEHRQKLLGRLRSRKWSKPKHLSQTHKKPLWKDFENVVHRVQHIYPKKSERKVRADVEKHLRQLQQAYEDFESIEDNGLDEHLQALIKTTFAFCTRSDVCKFAARLEGVGTTSQIAAAAKTLHQLEKIGAYWRIALSFISTAWQYSEVFRNVKLEYLIPYASVPTSIAHESWAKTCHVHAEVQLVVDYALHRQGIESETNTKGGRIIWPKTIGTSKYLCYLCYLFLTYDGGYQVLNTHGRLYDQWTVPDLREYDENTRAKFEGVLERIDEHIRYQIEQTTVPVWRPEPMTSRQNLLSLDVAEKGTNSSPS